MDKLPVRAVRQVLAREGRRRGGEARVAIDEALAVRDTLESCGRARGLGPEAFAASAWRPFVDELLHPSAPGATPACWVAARLLAAVAEPACLVAALRLPLAPLLAPEKRDPRAPIPRVERVPEDVHGPFHDIPF